MAEQALREKSELEARVKYLQPQLSQLMREKRRNLRESPPLSDPSDPSDPNESQSKDHLFGPSSGSSRSSWKQMRWPREVHNDFKVDIPEFEGKLNLDEFLDWLKTMERVVDFKDISDERKVKLVALKLRKYASTWWANVLSKRAKKGKGKILSLRKMKGKLKEKFIPSHYLQENFSRLKEKFLT